MFEKKLVGSPPSHEPPPRYWHTVFVNNSLSHTDHPSPLWKVGTGDYIMCSISVCDIYGVKFSAGQMEMFPQKKLADVWAKSFCHSQGETGNSLPKPFANITNQML